MALDLRATFAKLPRWTLPIAGLTALFGLRPVAGWDIWWHLRTGEAAASLGSLLPTDPFSHTFAGQPWGHKDLGADLLLWAIHGLLGPPGLVFLRALLFALVVWVTLRGSARRHPSSAQSTPRAATAREADDSSCTLVYCIAAGSSGASVCP